MEYVPFDFDEYKSLVEGEEIRQDAVFDEINLKLERDSVALQLLGLAGQDYSSFTVFEDTLQLAEFIELSEVDITQAKDEDVDHLITDYVINGAAADWSGLIPRLLIRQGWHVGELDDDGFPKSWPALGCNDYEVVMPTLLSTSQILLSALKRSLLACGYSVEEQNDLYQLLAAQQQSDIDEVTPQVLRDQNVAQQMISEHIKRLNLNDN